MVIHEIKAIFFHIPKCAGTSIENALLPGKHDGDVFDAQHVFGFHNNIHTQHLDFEGLRAYLPEETLRSYYKFAFVRNTWDRLCSAFFYIKDYYEKDHKNFEEWIYAACAAVKNKKYPIVSHFKPQIDYLFDKDRNLVLDHVGHFETLQSDFNVVCHHLNIPSVLLAKTNISIRKNKPYTAYYTPGMVEAVREAYGEEIRYFNFKFGKND